MTERKMIRGDTPVRPCGDCAMCCKLLPIEVDEQLFSEAGKWCRQWKGRCNIYEQRPDECRDFFCFWSLGLIPEELNPKKTKCVLAMYKEGILIVYCDPAYPHAWETGKMGDYLAAWPDKKFVLQIGDDKEFVYPKGQLD